MTQREFMILLRLWLVLLVRPFSLVVFDHYEGCLNGGGQIRAAGVEAGRELLKRMRDEYAQAIPRDPTNSSANRLRTEMQEESQNPLLFHTQYHAVKPMDHLLSSAMKW